MKDKIILFIIGVLVGAVISTGAFYVYTITSNSCNNNQNIEMNNGQPPEKPDGENGQPPEKPSENNSQSSNTQNNN